MRQLQPACDQPQLHERALQLAPAPPTHAARVAPAAAAAPPALAGGSRLPRDERGRVVVALEAQRRLARVPAVRQQEHQGALLHPGRPAPRTALPASWQMASSWRQDPDSTYPPACPPPPPPPADLVPGQEEVGERVPVPRLPLLLLPLLLRPRLQDPRRRREGAVAGGRLRQWGPRCPCTFAQRCSPQTRGRGVCRGTLPPGGDVLCLMLRAHLRCPDAASAAAHAPQTMVSTTIAEVPAAEAKA
jgi:hypothetical protein